MEPNMNDPELVPLMAEYHRLLHAMQTGVAHTMSFKPQETEPKHLRVGVNAAMSDHAALALLLVKKGVITLSEYYSAMIEKMKAEVSSYEKILSGRYGRDITLH